MRVALFVLHVVLLVTVVSPSPAAAQASTDPWEFGVGAHVARREDSTVHHGGGLTIARQYERVAAVLEASGTRRHGHNDWRVVVGPRVTLGPTVRSTFFAQVLAGTLIRQRAADWAVLPGVGVDVRWIDWSAVRFQFDAPIERSDARTAASARASVWLIFR
ncbi:MAG: hypothetical protein O2930_13775 [Acidobacteria bacterium]|nr:hypothetical protein [Chloroflexota bacterium]MDA1185700.1 hypothetical protein [Acidobacteriota bacterium]